MKESNALPDFKSLQSLYTGCLTRVKTFCSSRFVPRCYLGYAPAQQAQAERLGQDLRGAGLDIVNAAAQVQMEDHIIILDSPAWQQLRQAPAPEFTDVISLIQERIAYNSYHLNAITVENSYTPPAGHDMRHCIPDNFCDATHYLIGLFNLVLILFSIPAQHSEFVPLRTALHRQWEQITTMNGN